jgi:hypothetical protein
MIDSAFDCFGFPKCEMGFGFNSYLAILWVCVVAVVSNVDRQFFLEFIL